MGGLLSIGAGPFQVPLIVKARERGLKVIAVDGDPTAPGLAMADEARIADVRDPEACLAVAREFGVEAVATLATEAGVVSAAFVADRLGLPGLPLPAARKATDKLAMRQAFEAAGLASTRYFASTAAEPDWAALETIGGPAVVKPANGAGSRGVSYVGGAEDYAAAYETARQAAGGASVLTEAYMPGHEVAVEALMIGERFELLCVSDKRRTDPPWLLDLSINYPSPRPPDEIAAITALAEGAARVLGIRNAPLHIEIIMTPDGPHLVEVAARGAGFHVFSTIAPWVTGIDTVGAQLDLACGREPNLSGRVTRGAVLDFPEVPPGVVTAISGTDEVRAHPDILFCEVFRKVGETVTPLTSGADRACAIAVRGQDLAAAHRTLAWARGVLRIETQGR